MKVAFVIPAADGTPGSPSAEAIVEIALRLSTSGLHDITLIAPLAGDLTTRLRHTLAERGADIRLQACDLPAFDSDTKHAGEMRSILWTRFLQDQAVDLLVMFHDARTGSLRCLRHLPATVTALVMPTDLETPDYCEAMGIAPGIVVAPTELAKRLGRAWKDNSFAHLSGLPPQADSAETESPLPTELLDRLLETASKLQRKKQSQLPVPAAQDFYRQMVDDLRKLRGSSEDMQRCANAIAYNEGAPRRRQLLLDVSVIVHGDARSGIQRVVRSLVVELLNAPPVGFDVRPIHFYATSYRYAHQFARAVAPDSYDVEGIDTYLDLRPGDVYLALDLNTHLVEPAHEAFLDMKARGVLLNFVVYDILLIHHPEWWVAGLSDGFAKWLESIATLADTLPCISAAVAQDVRAWIDTRELPRLGTARTSSFHLGADVANSMPSLGMPEGAALVLERIRAAPSFLTVGTIEPRKGHAQALAAFEHLWAQGVDCNLVIVGRGGWLVDELIARLKAHPEKNLRLFWLDGISDEFLEAIYQACTCLIAGSLGEGFGLPLVEAAQHGLPIIARDLPVFREVAGDNVMYFDGAEPEALADVIVHWMALHGRQAVPDSRQLRFLTWKESAQQLQRALGLTPGPSIRKPATPPSQASAPDQVERPEILLDRQ